MTDDRIKALWNKGVQLMGEQWVNSVSEFGVKP